MTIQQEKKAQKNRKYRLSHQDKLKEDKRRYYLEHKEKCLWQSKESAKRRKRENPERFRNLALARLKKYHKTPKGIYKLLKRRSKNNPQIISQKDFIEWYEKQEKYCYYCEIPERLVGYIKNKNGRQRLSIDRIDNDKGYIKGNLCLACFSCNCVKNTIFDAETMKKLAIQFIKPLWKNFE